MADFKFNVNQQVKVKLTEKGIKILKEKHDSLNEHIISRGGTPLGEFELRLDEDGYYRTQLWCLMHDFGKHMFIGTDNPFETDMIFVGGKEV